MNEAYKIPLIGNNAFATLWHDLWPMTSPVLCLGSGPHRRWQPCSWPAVSGTVPPTGMAWRDWEPAERCPHTGTVAEWYSSCEPHCHHSECA